MALVSGFISVTMINHDWFGLHKILFVSAKIIMMWMFKKYVFLYLH